jgi:prophage antirepressor-like protein
MFENQKPTIEEEMEKFNLLNMEIEKQELEVINNIGNTNSFNNLMNFVFEGKEIRAFIINDIPYFIGKEIAKLLEYTDTAQAVRDLCNDQIDVGTLVGDGVEHNTNEIKYLRTLDPKTKLIPEWDVYLLVSRSKKPNAETFRMWLYKEVLPSIRKTGNYISNNNILVELLNEIKLLKEENQEIKSLISNFLTHDNSINTNRTFFNLQEVCDFLNKKYKITNGIIPNPKILKEFLKHVGVLKSNYTPYVSYINKNYIDNNLNLSVFGINHMLKEAGKYMIEL